MQRQVQTELVPHLQVGLSHRTSSPGEIHDNSSHDISGTRQGSLLLTSRDKELSTNSTMAIPAGRTLFKKKDGILTLTDDLKTVTWTPNTGGPPTISLNVANITSKAFSLSPRVLLMSY